MKESQLENKTSIATNDYVRMVDENGNSVKIKKDSFMAAIRDALPSIISDGETGGGSVLSIINGALKSRTDANLASVLGANWPTIDGDASPGNPYNFGKIFGLLRVTIVNTKGYTTPSYIIVSAQNIIELYKGWYITSWTINSSEELLITTNSSQHVFVTKIM